MIGQREQYDTLRYLMHTQLIRSSYRWMLKQVPYVMRICPYLNLVLPVNKRPSFEIPHGLSALF